MIFPLAVTSPGSRQFGRIDGSRQTTQETKATLGGSLSPHCCHLLRECSGLDRGRSQGFLVSPALVCGVSVCKTLHWSYVAIAVSRHPPPFYVQSAI